MGMHADCGHAMIMATSMAQLHMKIRTSVMSLQGHRQGWQSTSMCAVLPRGLVMSSLDTLQRVGVSPNTSVMVVHLATLSMWMEM